MAIFSTGVETLLVEAGNLISPIANGSRFRLIRDRVL